jgi:antirestriction protein ArdC
MNIYSTITERILKQMEEGVIPWHKTWRAGLPKNTVSGKEYRGVNILVLGLADHTSCYWLTYRQALQLGGHVRKGERSTPVIYWKWRTPEEIARRAAETGNEEIAPCVPFVSAVFNLDQTEGIAWPADDIQHRPEDRLTMADQMLDVMPDKPEIVHAVTANPVYSPRLDRVTLPHLSQFESADDYFSTLFHELTHSSGHPRRLNRFAETEGDQAEKYSFEELVAEFGAAFLCGFAGIENGKTHAQQASYIEGWARVFRQDSRILVRAASAAQRAADYIRGKTATEHVSIAAEGAQSMEASHA